MKGKVYFIAIILAGLFYNKLGAQYVAITDTEFVTWLQGNGYSQCFNGYELDTTCDGILNTSFLNANNITGHLAFKSLDGIQYFKNLDTLWCSGDSLTTLASLPNNLKWIVCAGNFLTTLPDLPPILERLYCQTNQLLSIPTLPPNLKELICEENPLRSLPDLPNSLLQLECSFDSLTSLPELPDSLYSFDCGFNPNLDCLPYLKRIVTLYFGGTNIMCVPNYGNVTHSIPSVNSLPLCEVSNPNNCPLFTAVKDIATGSFTLQPNPATNKLFCTATQFQPQTYLQIFDLDGRLIQSQPVVDENIEVDVSRLTTGMYFLVLQNERQRVVKKFVIE